MFYTRGVFWTSKIFSACEIVRWLVNCALDSCKVALLDCNVYTFESGRKFHGPSFVQAISLFLIS